MFVALLVKLFTFEKVKYYFKITLGWAVSLLCTSEKCSISATCNFQFITTRCFLRIERKCKKCISYFFMSESFFNLKEKINCWKKIMENLTKQRGLSQFVFVAKLKI